MTIPNNEGKITRPHCSRLRHSFVIRHSSFVISGKTAFTLIELLVVLTTIMILTGMVLSAAGFVAKKGARTRAESEMAALTAALESYKADNGAYPRDPRQAGSSTDNLDPRKDGDPTSKNQGHSYSEASQFLYGLLSGDYDSAASNNSTTNYNNVIDPNEVNNKGYFPFNPGMLSITTQTQGKTTTPWVNFIRDPFGYPYGYSTAGETGITNQGYNPTYDLWSTGGTVQKGAQLDESQWIKNW